MIAQAKPPIVDQETWRKELDELRRREKAATRELDAIAAQRRRLPMVEMADYTLIGEDGPVRLVDVFKGRSQLIDLLPFGRQEEWQDSPEGWPQSPTYSRWLDSPDIARVYGPS